MTNDELADALEGLIGDVDMDAADALVEAACRLRKMDADYEPASDRGAA